MKTVANNSNAVCLLTFDCLQVACLSTEIENGDMETITERISGGPETICEDV